MKNYPLKIGDYIVVIFFLILGGTGVFFNVTGAAPLNENKYLVIKVDNVEIKEVSFGSEEEGEISFPFGDEWQYEGTVVFGDGKARLLPLDKNLCPRGICSHTGWISQKGEIIACLPNRILIFFTHYHLDDDKTVDGITK